VFARVARGVSVSETRKEAAVAVAKALRLDPSTVCWSWVPDLHADAITIHAPWSRVVVARTVTGAYRFAEDWSQGRCPWLLDSVVAAYPIEAAPPLTLRRMRELPVENANLGAFVRWACSPGRVGWPAVPGTRILGAWSNFRDAVVIREGGLYSVRTR
tara:strand:- start:648 stop:1121 length:474 start_codon:yes stop_codon:yes gene_type:complete